MQYQAMITASFSEGQVPTWDSPDHVHTGKVQQQENCCLLSGAALTGRNVSLSSQGAGTVAMTASVAAGSKTLPVRNHAVPISRLQASVSRLQAQSSWSDSWMSCQGREVLLMTCSNPSCLPVSFGLWRVLVVEQPAISTGHGMFVGS